jgi:hypothetical protein
MANIRDKDINKLEDWELKDLRKLRITIKNRLSSLSSFNKNIKELPTNHPLKGMDAVQINGLLEKVLRSERKCSRE